MELYPLTMCYFIERTQKCTKLFFNHYISEKKKVKVKKTEVTAHLGDNGQVHFAIADDVAYRLETDVVERTAQCNFNDSTIATKLVSAFDQIFNSEEYSHDIPLMNLFSYDVK